MRIASMDLKVVKESFFEIPISSLILRSYWLLGVFDVWLPYGSWLHTGDKPYET